MLWLVRSNGQDAPVRRGRCGFDSCLEYSCAGPPCTTTTFQMMRPHPLRQQRSAARCLLRKRRSGFDSQLEYLSSSPEAGAAGRERAFRATVGATTLARSETGELGESELHRGHSRRSCRLCHCDQDVWLLCSVATLYFGHPCGSRSLWQIGVCVWLAWTAKWSHAGLNRGPYGY